MSRFGEQRFDQAWQEPEPFDNDTGDDSGLALEGEEVFDDQIEALALKPVECLEQSFRGSVQPSLIHVHGHEPVQQRGVFGCAPAGVIHHHFVGRVNRQTVLSRYATSDGRFACTAPAADPVDLLEFSPKRCTAGVSSCHAGNILRRGQGQSAKGEEQRANRKITVRDLYSQFTQK